MWHRDRAPAPAPGHRPARYLELVSKTEEELVVEAEPEAEQALKREAVLAAIVEAESIEVSDDEVDEALREAAGAARRDAGQAGSSASLERAREQGADEALREDIAMRKAVDLLVETAKPIPRRQAAGPRQALDARQGVRRAGSGEIWTPGS